MSGIFGRLFEDENAEDFNGAAAVLKLGLEYPPSPRLKCGLSGIDNQGATCYLNSLIQTLLLTPEFRDALFQLGELELGQLSNKDDPYAQVRIIPIQLQRLFAKLLLSNRQSVSTVELTESFGWTNNEGSQQHDVQELNRILFSAIEDSLVGTSGQDLIHRLYHGSIVNQIICQECKNISEREEDFLDISLAVADNSSLENSLSNSFLNMELMINKNRYSCELCQKLVNAKKGARIRNLPPILTLSLLRFSYNFVKMERYKETGKYLFPIHLDMKDYLEHEFEEVRLPAKPNADGSADVLEFDSPLELLGALLQREKSGALPVDKLCSEMVKQTGVSWNKRFKKLYGPINKFLMKHDDKFVYNRDTNWVYLKHESSTEPNFNDTKASEGKLAEQVNIKESGDSESTINSKSQADGDRKKENRPLTPPPPDGWCWFDFNDSRVCSIKQSDIDKQFSGKESAYMLFYRKHTLTRSLNARDDTFASIPERFIEEVQRANEELDQKRIKFDLELNKMTIQVHFSQNYDFVDGALKPIPDTCSFMEVSIDRRKSIAELRIVLYELASELFEDTCVFHRLRELPAGLHLYECVSENENKTLQDLDIYNGYKLFLWDGEKVQNVVIPTGFHCEPFLLTVIFGNSSQLNSGFSKRLTLSELKFMLCERIDIAACDMTLKKIVGKEPNVNVVEFSEDDADKTLEELNLNNGDQILAEDVHIFSSSLIESGILNRNRLILNVENRCSPAGDDGSYSIAKVDVEPTASILELKVLITSKFGIFGILSDCRLCVDHPDLGRKPPLHEELSLEDTGLSSGSWLILELGRAPLTSQMSLTFTAGDPKSDQPDLEVIVERKSTVAQCLRAMIDTSRLPGDRWHLRKTNWCGEAAEILDNVDATLEECYVQDGDHLLVEVGRLPPKGYIQLFIWRYPSPKPQSTDTQAGSGMLNWISSGLQGIISGPKSADESENIVPAVLGEVEVPSESSVEDLKMLILSLPEVQELPIPTPHFMRLRLVDNGRLTQVLKPHNQTLQRLKLSTSSHIGIQLLQQEETIGPNHLVLSIRQRVPGSRQYGPEVEFVWDASQGATAQALRHALADLLLIPVGNVVMAKHFQQKFEWLPIQDGAKKYSNQKGKRKFSQPKQNLRNSPYILSDGDIIGVKDKQFDPENQDDFSMIEDDQGKEALQKIVDEKRKQRQKKKTEENGAGEPSKRRPEVGLSIKVDRFS